MGYTKTTWADRNVQYPNRYTKTDIDSDTVEFTAEPGTVTEVGTKVTAARMNNIETGIENLYAQNWTLLSTTTTPSDTSQVDINVSAYDYYLVRITNMSSSAAQNLNLRFNNNSAADIYNFTNITSAVSNGRSTSIQTGLSVPATADGFITMEIEILNIQTSVKIVKFNGSTSQSASSSCTIGSASFKDVTNLISQINFLLASGGNIKAGAVIKIWGRNSAA